MSRLEYLLAAPLLRWSARLSRGCPSASASCWPRPASRRSTATSPTSRGDAPPRPRPGIVLLLEPYSYGLIGKLAYLARLVRGMYHLRTAGLFVVDNAYLPIHVAPHRAGTTVVQVWHAVAALKRFGPTRWPASTSRSGRSCTTTTTSWSAPPSGRRAPWAAAFRTPARAGAPARHPAHGLLRRPERARGRTCPGDDRVSGPRRSARDPVRPDVPRPRRREAGRRRPRCAAAARRAAASDLLVLKAHPNLDRRLTDRLASTSSSTRSTRSTTS